MKLFSREKQAAEVLPVNRIALKGGSYSLVITAVVLALLIAVNLMFSALPKSLTRLDMSSTNLYSVTSNTKVVVNALAEDVTIYWIVQNDEEDSVIENLLAKYESLSDHIDVVKKNPDVYPTFTEKYTSETVSNNSLIVECGSKYRYISYDDIYLTSIDYTTYSYVYSFDGEGALTSAIDYVVSEELPKIYVLTGHGESELPSILTDQIEKENLETEEFSLLNVDEIPEDADCILIYDPSSDISQEEKTLLSEHIEGGGKLLILSGLSESGELENLNALLGDYGITPSEGIVVEGNRSYYAFQQPYFLMPDIQSSDVTASLIEEGYYVIMPISEGLTLGGTDSGSVTELLTTSSDAFSKAAGYDIETFDKEDGDTDGPFALAVEVETGGGGQMIYISSSYLLDEEYNAYSSGGNLSFAMNCLSSLIGESEAMAIRTKSLSYNYLTISDDAAALLKGIMIFVLPLLFVAAGIYVTTERRRRKQYEQV